MLKVEKERALWAFPHRRSVLWSPYLSLRGNVRHQVHRKMPTKPKFSLSQGSYDDTAAYLLNPVVGVSAPAAFLRIERGCRSCLGPPIFDLGTSRTDTDGTQGISTFPRLLRAI